MLDSSPESIVLVWQVLRRIHGICVNIRKFWDYRSEKIYRRQTRDNVIDGYINKNEEDVCAEGIWQNYFTEKPDPLTGEEMQNYLNQITGVALGSDAFFPFSDNIERAKRSGVSYIAQPGGSIRDDVVIDCCNKYGMVMAFTGMRLFHH